MAIEQEIIIIEYVFLLQHFLSPIQKNATREVASSARWCKLDRSFCVRLNASSQLSFQNGSWIWNLLFNTSRLILLQFSKSLVYSLFLLAKTFTFFKHIFWFCHFFTILKTYLPLYEVFMFYSFVHVLWSLPLKYCAIFFYMGLLGFFFCKSIM